ncbi:MAG TPA: tetratricopeptide repeat protein [Pyrinomonadaceae bacterium]|nr:tetratricopeptide repeat protein [Pyrinomonadaceae bacterium]
MKSKLRFRLLFVLISILLTTVFASSQGIGDRNRPSSGGSHVVSGKIRLPDGQPAINVRVTLTNTDIGTSTQTTDQDGAFAFSGMPEGNYTLTIRADGYQTENESFTIERFSAAGQGTQFAFVLRQPGQPKGDSRTSNPLLKDVPKDAVSKFEKGMEKASKDDAKGAVSDFDAAIAAYPNFAAAYYEKGAALLKTNDVDNALAAFVKAIQLKPDYIEAKYGYGLAMFQKKDYTVAAAAFNDVLQQRKDMAEAHLNLGISLFYLKNVDAAESELKTAVSTKGGEKLALAHLYLGQIYSQKKRNSDAVTELEKYLEMVPKAPNADRIKQAIEQLKKG